MKKTKDELIKEVGELEMRGRDLHQQNRNLLAKVEKLEKNIDVIFERERKLLIELVRQNFAKPSKTVMKDGTKTEMYAVPTLEENLYHHARQLR